MGKINSRTKGASGERELAKFLKNRLKLDFMPERNLEQVRSGGSDIINVYPFHFECKRVEVLDLQSWWIQSKSSAMKDGAIPVVAFRQNRKPWEFLIGANHIGVEVGYIRMKDKTFVTWALATMEKAKDGYLPSNVTQQIVN